MSHLPQVDSVIYAKGCRADDISQKEAAILAKKIAALPAWARHELDLAGEKLDVAHLHGTKEKWFRLKAPPFRVFFRTFDGLVVVGGVFRRDDHTYDDVSWLDGIKFVPRGTGLDVVDTSSLRSDATAPREVDGTIVQRRNEARLPRIENPLSALTDEQLSVLGAPEHLIHLMRGLAPSVDMPRAIASRGADADLVELLAYAWNEPSRFVDAFAEGTVPSIDDLRLTEEEVASRLGDGASMQSLVSLSGDPLARVLDGSLQDWMVFVHPSQVSMVRLDPTGPMSIRGGPGTGKTAVALHRARWLVHGGHATSVLLTTFVNSLPRVWSDLLDAMIISPREREAVTTRTVDSLAWAVVREATGAPTLVTGAARTDLLERTLVDVPEARIAIGDVEGFGEEIDVVIAGRGLGETSYYDAQRRGRRRALAAAQRRHVWRAYQGYLAALAERESTDWAHLRVEALRLAESGAGPRFDALIIDEAQDLSEVQLRFLLSLDADPNHTAVTIVGDAGQSIYPGGSSLGALGLDVRGRAYVLRTNWRNTQYISMAADAILATGSAGAGEEDSVVPESSQVVAAPQRLGRSPVALHATSTVGLGDEVFTQALGELADLGYAREEIAVLCPTNEEVEHVLGILAPDVAISLADLSGLPEPGRVSIGTFHRAKGFEFKAVIVVAVGLNFDKARAAVDDDAADNAEKADRLIRSVYVAMTRARDELTLIGLSPLDKRLVEAARDGALVLVEWDS